MTDNCLHTILKAKLVHLLVSATATTTTAITIANSTRSSMYSSMLVWNPNNHNKSKISQLLQHNFQ